MEGKFELQVEDNEYYLVDGKTNDTIATTDKVLLKEYDGYMKKLSLKNCEAIANGYDLDELIEDIVKTIVPNDRGDDIWYGTSMAVGKLCFQKALEILGDKKFSEKDVHHALHLMNNQVRLAYIDNALEMVKKSTEQRDNIIQSLQQTEWDVEVEQELIQSSIEGEAIWETKLDADGCLILKRI